MRKSQLDVASVLIIALVVAVILIAAVASYFKSFESKGDVESCRLSVLLAYGIGSNAPIVDLFKNLNTKLRCVAPYAHIESKEKNDKLAKHDVMSRLAVEMRNCWYKMGAGDMTFLNSRWDESRICIICSEFSLDRDIGTEEMYGFLKSTDMPNTQEKYISYFDTDFQEPSRWDSMLVKGGLMALPFAAAGGLAAGGVAAGVAGASAAGSVAGAAAGSTIVSSSVGLSLVQAIVGGGELPQTFFLAADASGAIVQDRMLQRSSRQSVRKGKETRYAVLYLRSGYAAWSKFFLPGISMSKAPEQDFQTFMVIPKRDIARAVMGSDRMCSMLFYQTKSTGWLFR